MNIYQSISAIQADVDFIGKDKQAAHGDKYKYRGVDQVLNTLHPLFSKHKVFAVPEVQEILNREERTTKSGGNVTYQVAKVKYTFYAEDGTSVSAVVLGEAMDSGDKVSNKCMSVAYKYACFQVLSIPTEETTVDPDDASEELQKTPRKTAQKATDRAREHFIVSDLKSAGLTDIEGSLAIIEEKCGVSHGEWEKGDWDDAKGKIIPYLIKLQDKRQQSVNDPDIPF